jgi:hypothetical protein
LQCSKMNADHLRKTRFAFEAVPNFWHLLTRLSRPQINYTHFITHSTVYAKRVVDGDDNPTSSARSGSLVRC